MRMSFVASLTIVSKVVPTTTYTKYTVENNKITNFQNFSKLVVTKTIKRSRTS